MVSDDMIVRGCCCWLMGGWVSIRPSSLISSALAFPAAQLTSYLQIQLNDSLSVCRARNFTTRTQCAPDYNVDQLIRIVCFASESSEDSPADICFLFRITW